MIVVADTSPLRYLILIEHTHVLPALYGSVVVPSVVVQELTQSRTPDLVRAWLADRPEWLQVRNSMRSPSALRSVLGPGEREAIAIAEELSADVLLMDDRAGRREAEGRHLFVLGTLRVLADAAEHDLADLPAAFDRLRRTNFRAADHLMQELLARDAKRRGAR